MGAHKPTALFLYTDLKKEKAHTLGTIALGCSNSSGFLLFLSQLRVYLIDRIFISPKIEKLNYDRIKVKLKFILNLNYKNIFFEVLVVSTVKYFEHCLNCV